MALGTHAQFHTLLKEKKHVLITAGVHSGGDGIASAIAVSLFLDAIGVRSDIVIDGFSSYETYQFLPKVTEIKPKFEYLKKFILNIDITNTGVRELSYDVSKETNKLRIFITPKQGEIDRQHITTSQSAYRYDAIVVLDADDRESIGALYQEYTSLFFETPLVNIGHTASNEHYGNINIIDVTASATAEVLYEIFMTIGKEHISETIATALLTGMISKTNSFKAKDIAPKSLGIASKLMKLGANRDIIIEKLYRTRTISSLKLWGEALTHLQHDAAHNLVWATLTREAFARSGATEHDLYDLVPELISSSPSAQLIVLLHEHQNDRTVHALIYSKQGMDAREFVKEFDPTGTARSANVYIQDTTLAQAEERIIASVRAKL